MDLKSFFSIKKNIEQNRWEFNPNKKVKSCRYTVSFFEADNEEDAWITLFLAVKKSPEFKAIELTDKD